MHFLKPYSRSRSQSSSLCGLFVALFIVSSWVSLSLGPIPFTLQTLAIMLALLLLNFDEVLISLFVYLLLGAVGLPVFSGMRGGLAMLLGPTGGFLWGFLLASAIALWVRAFLVRGSIKSTAKQRYADAICLAVFMVVVYIAGCLQFVVVTHTDIISALALTVAPFIIIDIAKAIAAFLLARIIRSRFGYSC